MWTLDPSTEPLRCSICGDQLTGDGDDDPGHPTGPMCGECFRAREFDEQLWAMEASEQDDDLW
jgi:hypothetical protein